MFEEGFRRDFVKGLGGLFAGSVYSKTGSDASQKDIEYSNVLESVRRFERMVEEDEHKLGVYIGDINRAGCNMFVRPTYSADVDYASTIVDNDMVEKGLKLGKQPGEVAEDVIKSMPAKRYYEDIDVPRLTPFHKSVLYEGKMLVELKDLSNEKDYSEIMESVEQNLPEIIKTNDVLPDDLEVKVDSKSYDLDKKLDVSGYGLLDIFENLDEEITIGELLPYLAEDRPNQESKKKILWALNDEMLDKYRAIPVYYLEEDLGDEGGFYNPKACSVVLNSSMYDQGMVKKSTKATVHEVGYHALGGGLHHGENRKSPGSYFKDSLDELGFTKFDERQTWMAQNFEVDAVEISKDRIKINKVLPGQVPPKIAENLSWRMKEYYMRQHGVLTDSLERGEISIDENGREISDWEFLDSKGSINVEMELYNSEDEGPKRANQVFGVPRSIEVNQEQFQNIS